MANAAEIQAALDPAEMTAKILRFAPTATTGKQAIYVQGGGTYLGRARWVSTNVASSASAQATSIAAQML